MKWLERGEFEKLQGSEETKLKVRENLEITKRRGQRHSNPAVGTELTREPASLMALDFSGNLKTEHQVEVQQFHSGMCNR